MNSDDLRHILLGSLCESMILNNPARKTLDSNRLELADSRGSKDYWMTCPKCGDHLAEVEMLGLKLDKCSGCEGIYFDKGELDILLNAYQEQKKTGSKPKLSGSKEAFS